LPRLPSKPPAERTVRDFAAFAVVLFFDELLLRELWAALLVKANPAYGLGSTGLLDTVTGPQQYAAGQAA